MGRKGNENGRDGNEKMGWDGKKGDVEVRIRERNWKRWNGGRQRGRKMEKKIYHASPD